MGRRRTGTVYEKPKGSGKWWYAFLLRSGKRWTKPVPPRPDGKPITEADAELYKTEVLRRYELGLWDPEKQPEPAKPAPSIPTVAEYGTAWSRSLGHDSAENVRRIVDQYIAPSELGAMRLDEPSPPDVAVFVRTMVARPSRMGGTLAPLSVREIYQVLKRLYEYAIFEGKVATSPCVLPKGLLPKRRDKVPGAREGWSYQRDEVEQLISDVRIPPVRRVLYTALFCGGPRIGEAVALKWRDLDTTLSPLGRLTVLRAVAQRPKRLGGARIKGTKTDAVKLVPVHPTLAAALAEWKLSGWSRLVGKTTPPGPEDLIFPTRNGTMRNTRNAYHDLRRDCRALEITPRRLHGTRHTFISLTIDDGARADIIERITHARPVHTAFDEYRRRGSWDVVCIEVMRLNVRRRADELPLVRAANERDARVRNATDSATGLAPTRGNALLEDSRDASRACRREGSASMRETENAGELENPSETARENPVTDAVSGGDSTTAGSAIPAVGPHTGEAFAQLWFERALLQGEP